MSSVQDQLMNHEFKEILLASCPPPVIVSSSQSGIYFLLLKGEVVYVGQSKINVHARALKHTTDSDKEFDSYTWLLFEPTELDNMEAFYILKLNPRFNKLVPGNEYFMTKAHLRKVYGITKPYRLTALLKRPEITEYLFESLHGWQSYYDIAQVVDTPEFQELIEIGRRERREREDTPEYQEQMRKENEFLQERLHELLAEEEVKQS